MVKLRCFSPLLLCLVLSLLAACRPPSSDSLVVQATPAASPTAQNQVATPTVQPPPPVTITPTSTSIPKPSGFLPIMFNSEQPLGVRWFIPDLYSADFLEAMDALSPLLIYIENDWKAGEHTLVALEVRSGLVRWKRPLSSADDEFLIGENVIYMLLEPAEPSDVLTVQAIDLEGENVLWNRELLNFRDYDAFALIHNVGILLSFYDYSTQMTTFILLDKDDGKLVWQTEATEFCPSFYGSPVFVSGQLVVSCGESYLFLDAVSGRVIKTVALVEESSRYNMAANAVQIFHLRSAWEGSPQAQHIYLESLSMESGELIWQRELPYANNIPFVLSDELLIYRLENKVIALDAVSGMERWQTALEEYVPSGLLLQDDYLYVGSRTGFLHILDITTGQIVWDQDIWATVDFRPYLILPTMLISDTVVLNTEQGYMALSVDGNLQPAFPDEAATALPTPRPTETPQPILSPSEDIILPTDLAEWPAAIVSFLNGRSPAEDTLEEVARLVNEQFDVQLTWRPLATSSTFTEAWFILIDPFDYASEGWALIVGKNLEGSYILEMSMPALNPINEQLVDLNNDGWEDIVYETKIYGANFSGNSVTAVLWDGSSSQLAGSLSMINMGERIIEDRTGDGMQEIILHGGEMFSVAAGLTRPITQVYALQDNQYKLISEQPDLPQPYYFFVMDANELFLAEEYEAAIVLYQSTINSEEAIYNWYAPHQKAFAELQIMLAYILLDDMENAAQWAGLDEYAGELYGQVKSIFWEKYQQTNDWTIAAESARLRVRQAGFENVQLDNVGYENRYLALHSIIPCSDCLQGEIGNPYR